MNKAFWLLGLAFVGFAFPADALDRAQMPNSTRLERPEATTDPLKGIYRVSGVRDNGGAINTGVATSFHCTNFSTVTENIRYLILNFNGIVVADVTATVASFRTHTASTHGTVMFNEDAFLSTGTVIEQGFAIIQATSPKVFCSAMIIDAAAAVPNAVSLHMVRVSPVPGTQE